MGNSLCTIIASSRIRRSITEPPLPVISKAESKINTVIAEHIANHQTLAKNPHNDDVCVICLDTIHETNYIIKLPCNHVYHSDCLYKWVCKKRICPMCGHLIKFDLKGV